MNLFEELKRRNVLRVAVAYVAATWLLIQVLETLFPIFGLSETSLRIVVIVLAVSFVPALVFTWAFELTPQGLKPDSEVAPDALSQPQTHKLLDRVIMITLALAVGYFAFDKFVLSESRETSIAETARQEGRTEALVESYGDQSIAVLPFVNMSSDPEQAFFSDGIAEEMLNLLAKIPQLRVISRSSSFAFRGDDINIPEVAEKLNVAHILEGSVRRAGNQVRIAVQLIEARSDTHLWSETYDRPLDDIFAIQDDVAAQVVEQLRLTLLGKSPRAARANVLAYPLYLQARQIVKLQLADEYPKAEALLKQALDFDPTYVDALTELMSLYSYQQYENESGADRLDKLIEQTRVRVLTLDPDNPRLKIFMAWGKMFDDNDLVAAARLFQDANTVDPSNLDALLGSATLASRIGQSDLAIHIFEYLTERDPLNLWVHWNLGRTYLQAGRIEDALRRQAIAISLNPDAKSGRWKSGLVKLVVGDPAGALADFELEPHVPYRLHGMALALHDLGRAEESAGVLRDLHGIHADEFWPHGYARAYAWLGNNDEAFRYLQLTAEIFPQMLQDTAVNPLYRKLHGDPRWLPFLREIGRAPEQLAAIEIAITMPE